MNSVGVVMAELVQSPLDLVPFFGGSGLANKVLESWTVSVVLLRMHQISLTLEHLACACRITYRSTTAELKGP